MGVKSGEDSWLSCVLDLAKVLGWRRLHILPARIKDKNDGTWQYRTPVSGDGRDFPDLLLLRDKRQIVAELKVGENMPTPGQLQWLAAFKLVGAEIYTWRPEDFEEVKRILAR